MAAVLREDPTGTKLRARAGTHHHLLQRCLQKDLSHRLAISPMRALELEEALRDRRGRSAEGDFCGGIEWRWSADRGRVFGDGRYGGLVCRAPCSDPVSAARVARFTIPSRLSIVGTTGALAVSLTGARLAYFWG